jgi:hypothetical protein
MLLAASAFLAAPSIRTYACVPAFKLQPCLQIHAAVCNLSNLPVADRMLEKAHGLQQERLRLLHGNFSPEHAT